MMMKPSMWAVTPGLVDPKWRRLWAHAHLVIPIWEHGGGTIFNYGRHKTTLTLNSLPWQPSDFGIGVEQADDGDLITLSPVLSIAGWSEFTFFCHYTFKTDGVGNPGFWRSLGGNTFNLLRSGNGPWIRWDGDELFLNTSWGSLGDVGTKSVGFSVGQTTQSAYLDGGQKVTRTGSVTWPTGTNADIDQFGENGSTEHINGIWGVIYVLDTQFTDNEHLDLALDPFGPITMADEVPAIIGAAAVTPAEYYKMHRMAA